jgi:ribonuclease HII
MPDFSREIALGLGSGVLVCGCDEVGRGPIAGDVTAASVCFSEPVLPARLVGRIRDSKRLTARARAEIAAMIREDLPYGIGVASVEEIFELGILKATFLAMRRAVEALPVRPGHAIVDGNQLPPLPCAASCVVKADALCLSVAAASIVAKDHRSRTLRALAERFPGYGWERNDGYGTPEHLKALAELGPTPHHRAGFEPVKSLLAIRSPRSGRLLNGGPSEKAPLRL